MSEYAYAPIPANDEERTEAVQSLALLDTPREELYDCLIQMVSLFCEVPICAFTLVDKDRQWFKASIGLDVRETPREMSFCGHAINQDSVFVVENAEKDSRFAKNPLVLGPPKIKFYAGVPVYNSEGLALGTMCAIDNVERQLTDMQLLGLQLIAKKVGLLLTIRANEILNNDARSTEILKILSQKTNTLTALFPQSEEVGILADRFKELLKEQPSIQK